MYTMRTAMIIKLSSGESLKEKDCVNAVSKPVWHMSYNNFDSIQKRSGEL